MNFSPKLHQTTLGFEWKKNENYPRIKLYFEELFRFYSNLELFKKMKEICQVLKINNLNEKIFFQDLKIGAFCIDFFSQRKTDFKVYFLFREKKFLEQVLEKYFSKIPHNMKNLLNLNSKNKSFFYLTFRIDSNEKVKSLKVYKIYEIQQNPPPILSQIILECITFLKHQKRFFSYLSNLCESCLFYYYPVILSTETSFSNEFKHDFYFSLKPKS